MAESPLAIITGGAHRLGYAFALSLARQGYAILLHYRSSAGHASSAVQEIQRLGVPVHTVQSDLTDLKGIEALCSALDGIPNRLKVLVNSAAVMQRKDIRHLTADEWDATLSLNLRAPFLLTQRAAERMTGGGLVVNVTDVGAHKLWASYPAYVVSKAALETLTRLMAKAYAPRIRVNAIAPGLVLPSEKVSPEEWKKLVGRLPLQRPTTPEEIASALEFLLRNESVTGQTITVDSGYSLLMTVS